MDGIALVLIGDGGRARAGGRASWRSWHDADEAGEPAASKTYFALMLVLETMMVGVFAATDVFLFYVFFEAMLDPDVLPDRQLRRPAAGSTRR